MAGERRRRRRLRDLGRIGQLDARPAANGAEWDLTQAAAQALRFEHTDEIRVAKIAGRPSG